MASKKVKLSETEKFIELWQLIIYFMKDISRVFYERYMLVEFHAGRIFVRKVFVLCKKLWRPKRNLEQKSKIIKLTS